mmetsp:Transcript_31239/g.103421  ORF Transcript_31239/g.103421 Transcript_31239/m.103421 type:complete len:205 (+) Transcript_31239:86-700(+)
MSGQRNSRTRARRGVEIIALVRGAGGALRARGSSAHAVLDSLQAGDERHRQPEEGARQRAVGIEQRPGGVEHVVLWDERARHPLEAEDVCDEGHVVCVDRDAAVAHERQHAAQHLPEPGGTAEPEGWERDLVRSEMRLRYRRLHGCRRGGEGAVRRQRALRPAGGGWAGGGTCGGRGGGDGGGGTCCGREGGGGACGSRACCRK